MRRHNIWIILPVLAALSFAHGCALSPSSGASGTDKELRLGEADSRTTDSRSTSFQDREEKLAFLQTYLDLPSGVSDAEYHIVYQDNSQGAVPGPSDWEIRAALQVEKEDISLWTDGMKKILPQQTDSRWWEDLKTPSFTWELSGDAQYYKRPDSQSYLVVCPGSGIILKYLSTTYIPQTPDAEPGDEDLKAAAAGALGYDASTAPYIETAQVMQTRTADGEAVDLVCLRAMFYDSPIYGIPVLAIRSGNGIQTKVLCEGSYEDEFYLADITGDGVDELLASHCVSITGGAGSYQSAIYQLDGSASLKTRFENPDSKTDAAFDTGFGLHMAEDFICTVSNGYTGSQTTFTHSSLKDSPYYDHEGNLTDRGRERNQADLLDTDRGFFIFRPVDTDGDGIYEISTAQYSYLWGRSDSLGSACTILRWNDDPVQPLYVSQARFLANGEEGQGDALGYDWYEEPQATENTPEETRRQVCTLIETMDFTPRLYPVNAAFTGSDADRTYRDVFYQVVNNQRPVLCRTYRSLDYEEKYYRVILNVDYLGEKEFQSQVLRQDSRYYYMDYDGDGLPELMVRHNGIYGFKYLPQEDKVYLFVEDAPSSYGYLMGAGQTYSHNPCIAGKDTYGYSSEDRNGNREWAGFETRSEWNWDTKTWKTYYYVSAGGFRNVEVSGAVWNRLAGRLRAAYEQAPAAMSYEEFSVKQAY